MVNRSACDKQLVYAPAFRCRDIKHAESLESPKEALELLEAQLRANMNSQNVIFEINCNLLKTNSTM